jgi:hypothetical protein
MRHDGSLVRCERDSAQRDSYKSAARNQSRLAIDFIEPVGGSSKKRRSFERSRSSRQVSSTAAVRSPSRNQRARILSYLGSIFSSWASIGFDHSFN